jgi:hypothetical protein
MRIVDFLLRRPAPGRVAAVYPNREIAFAAAEAAKGEGETDDDHIRVVGPLDEVIGNQPSPSVRGAWAVVAQPDTYTQCKQIVRALRRPLRRRGSDRVGLAQSRNRSPAAAGLVTDRS